MGGGRKSYGALKAKKIEIDIIYSFKNLHPQSFGFGFSPKFSEVVLLNVGCHSFKRLHLRDGTMIKLDLQMPSFKH